MGDDYSEMVMQYGFITMFAAVLPIAPALALANNLFEARIDLEKLLKSRRMKLRDRCGRQGEGVCMGDC